MIWMHQSSGTLLVSHGLVEPASTQRVFSHFAQFECKYLNNHLKFLMQLSFVFCTVLAKVTPVRTMKVIFMLNLELSKWSSCIIDYANIFPIYEAKIQVSTFVSLKCILHILCLRKHVLCVHMHAVHVFKSSRTYFLINCKYLLART